MDHNVVAADRLYRDQEAAAEGACRQAASLHGVLTQAEDCEDGALQCPQCPWRARSAASDCAPHPTQGTHHVVDGNH